MRKFNTIISIDPAGKGNSGIIIWDLINNCLMENITIYSNYSTEAVNSFKILFDLLKQRYKNIIPIIIIEDFHLSKNLMITNPLETPKLIEGIKTLLNHLYKWFNHTQHSSKKKGYQYRGSTILDQHQHDAYKHKDAFLERVDNIEGLSQAEKDWIKKHSSFILKNN